MKKFVLLCLFILLSSFVSATIPVNNVVSYFSGDSADTDGNIAIDSAGIGNGTIIGGVTNSSDCILNQCYYMNGVNQYINVSVIPASIPNGCAGGWVRVDDVSSHRTFIEIDNNAGQLQFRWLSPSDDIYTKLNNNQVQYTTNTVTGGGFDHIVMSWDGTNRVLWVNGTVINNVSNANTYNYQADATYCIGMGTCWSGGTVNDMKGYVDEIFILNQSCTQADVETIYNAGAGYNPFQVGPVYSITDTPIDVDPELENSVTQLNLSITTQNHNLTASNYGAVIYNGTTYTATKISENYGVSGNVTYAVNVTTPIVYTNNTAIPYTWVYNLTINASDEANYSDSSSSQSVIWKLHHLFVLAKDNITGSYLDNITITAFNSTYNQTSISTGNTTQIVLKAGIYNLNISVNGYTVNNTINKTLSGITSTYTVGLWESKSIYLTIYDELTENLINASVNIGFINDAGAVNYTTSNGTLYASGLNTGEYRIEFSSSGYPERLYYVTLTSTSSEQLELYLLNDGNASQIDVSVFDEVSEAVTNTYVKILRYYLSCNCYKTVEIGKTNFEGDTFIQAQEDEEFYKVIIADNGETYLTTDPFKITSTTLTFFINLGVIDPTATFDKVQNIYESLTFNNVTKNFKYTWSDTNNNVVKGCLKTYKVSVSSETLLNSNCVSSTASTILINIPAENNTLYKAVSSLYLDGSTETIRDILFVDFNTGKLVFGNMGVFLSIFLLIILTLIGKWNPNVSVIFLIFALIAVRILGMLNLGLTALMALIGVGIIIIIQNRA